MSDEECLHPWASKPRSVGALAITQLAALASTDDLGVKEKIREQGAIPLLVDNLICKEEDRAEAALVAVSFLSISCE